MVWNDLVFDYSLENNLAFKTKLYAAFKLDLSQQVLTITTLLFNTGPEAVDQALCIPIGMFSFWTSHRLFHIRAFVANTFIGIAFIKTPVRLKVRTFSKSCVSLFTIF